MCKYKNGPTTYLIQIPGDLKMKEVEKVLEQHFGRKFKTAYHYAGTIGAAQEWDFECERSAAERRDRA